MLKFFRKIRRRLLSESKFRKYLIYAIGEIILVVIGILIALQINNWNNKVQNKKIERQTLINFKNELAIQRNIINSQLSFENWAINYVDSCFILLKHNTNIRRLASLLDSLSRRRTFVSSTATFENIGLNKKATITTNADLQNEIVKYYQLLEYTKSVVNNNNLFRINSQFGAFVANNDIGFKLTSHGKLDTNFTISPDKRFALKKQLDGRRFCSTNNIDKCLEQLNKTNILIKLIDTELKKSRFNLVIKSDD